MDTEQGERPKTHWLTNGCLAIAVGCFAAIALCAVTTVITHLLIDDSPSASRPHPITEVVTVRGTLLVPGRGYIDGRSGETEALGVIDVWDKVAGTRKTCNLAHSAAVYISAAKWMAEEHCYYLRVRRGACEGWVSEPYVSPEQQGPLEEPM